MTPDGRKLVVSNMTSGFDIYDIETGASLRALGHRVAELLAIPVMFAQGGAVIVGGSAVGKAHIWDATTYELCQDLSHEGEVSCVLSAMQRSCTADSDRILALDAHDNRVNNRYLIATGISNPGLKPAVTLWYAEEKADSLGFREKVLNTIFA